MKKTNQGKTAHAILMFLFVCLSMFYLIAQAQPVDYELAFSTYIGGSGYDMPRDVAVDAQGNIYIVGGTTSADFPTTPGAYDRTRDSGGAYAGTQGPWDVFVAKFDKNGNLIWSTYLGGPNYDRAYAVEVDNSGYVYVAGRAGPGFPVTPNVFQPTFQGTDNGIYGMQNGFVAKISPNGSSLEWASYVGVGQHCRDLAIDGNGDIYLPSGYTGSGPTPPQEWFKNAFQKTPRGGEESGVVKVKSDGSQVLWATWLGGSGNDGQSGSIRVDATGYVYIGTSTDSNDIPTTAGAYDRTHNGNADFYVARLTPDGSGLVFCTYLGGSGDEWIGTHNLAIDQQGNTYASIFTNSPDFPITQGVFQQTFAGSVDWGIAKLSPTGALMKSTLVGGNGQDNPDGTYVDANGNIFVSGVSPSVDFPVTSNAYQPDNKGGQDAALILLSADFTQLHYSTYMGGSSNDNGRAGFMDSDGNLYIAGTADGPGWPTHNAYQSSYAGGSHDGIVAKFNVSAPSPLNIGTSSLPDGIVNQLYTATLAATGGTIPYTWSIVSGSLPVGLSLNTTTGLISGTPTTEGTSSFTVQVTDSDSPPDTDSKALSITVNPAGDELVGYWPFDEGNGLTAHDISGNGNHGTLVNGPTWTTGKLGSALSFDGGNDYVICANESDFDFTSSFSISLWAKRNATGAISEKIICKPGAARYYDWNFAIGLESDTDGYVHGGFWVSAFTWIGVYSVFMADTNWHHIAFVVDFGTKDAYLYDNGLQVDTSSWTTEVPATNNNPVYIGAADASNAFFNGIIDDVRIYSRALSQSEVQTLANPTTSIGTLQFSTDHYTVNENGSSANITVTRTDGSDGVVTVDYATADGTATAGLDYTSTSGTITFTDGEMGSKTFSIPILDDGLVEGDETVNLTLSNPTGGATLGNPGAAVLTITDNDTLGKPGKPVHVDGQS